MARTGCAVLLSWWSVRQRNKSISKRYNYAYYHKNQTPLEIIIVGSVKLMMSTIKYSCKTVYRLVYHLVDYRMYYTIINNRLVEADMHNWRNQVSIKITRDKRLRFKFNHRKIRMVNQMLVDEFANWQNNEAVSVDKLLSYMNRLALTHFPEIDFYANLLNANTTISLKSIV